MRRENETFLTYKNLRENRERLAKKELDRINESKKQKDNFMNNYYSIKESRIMKENERSILLEAARNDALATAIKAIYITALEAETMTDNGILLAENMVDNWINERGGASNILTPTVANSTYLLSRITQIVEDAAKEEVENIESEEDDNNGSKDLEISKLSAKEAEIKAQIAKLRAQKKAEEEGVSIDDNKEEVEDTDATVDTDDKADGVEVSDMDMDEGNEDKVDTENGVKDKDGKEKTSPDEEEVEDTDTKEESSEEDKEDKKEEDTKEEKEDTDTKENEEESSDTEEEEDDIELADTEVDVEEDSSDSDEEDEEDKKEDTKEEDSDEEEDEEDDEEDEEEDVVIDDEESEDDSVKDSNDKILDALDKEDDIHKAIDTIRDRVAKAEERFIKNNAEDKKKIEELLQKIENSTNAANSLKGKDDAKAEVAKESAFLGKRKADEIRNKVNNNKITIFEKMTNILTQNIVKDDAIRESYYTTDEGRLDVDLAVESAKVMYGFLETLNTIKLEKVNEAYIENVLNTMKNN
jgi:hypothetical protein